MSIFENTLNQIIDLYENDHKGYKEPKFSVTNPINYYVKNNNIKALINFKKLYTIYEDYTKFIKSKELLQNQEGYYDEETKYDNEKTIVSKFNQ